MDYAKDNNVMTYLVEGVHWELVVATILSNEYLLIGFAG